MLIMGGQALARQRISRTIGRRGLIRMESIPSVDSGLSVLEWRNYDLVGAFLCKGLSARLEEAFVLRDAHVQLVVFGTGFEEDVIQLRRRLHEHGLPSPIVVRADFDAFDESLFWRSLAGHLMLPVPDGVSTAPGGRDSAPAPPPLPAGG